MGSILIKHRFLSFVLLCVLHCSIREQIVCPVFSVFNALTQRANMKTYLIVFYTDCWSLQYKFVQLIMIGCIMNQSVSTRRFFSRTETKMRFCVCMVHSQQTRHTKSAALLVLAQSFFRVYLLFMKCSFVTPAKLFVIFGNYPLFESNAIVLCNHFMHWSPRLLSKILSLWVNHSSSLPTRGRRAASRDRFIFHQKVPWGLWQQKESARLWIATPLLEKIWGCILLRWEMCSAWVWPRVWQLL